MSGRDFMQPASIPVIDGVRIGELIGFSGEGARPLVVYAGQPATPRSLHARFPTCAARISAVKCC
jgi:hypothetical protein